MTGPSSFYCAAHPFSIRQNEQAALNWQANSQSSKLHKASESITP